VAGTTNMQRGTNAIQHNQNNMKTYLIINGRNVTIIEDHSIDEAITYAQNYMDNSNEIIIREIEPEITLRTPIQIKG